MAVAQPPRPIAEAAASLLGRVFAWPRSRQQARQVVRTPCGEVPARLFERLQALGLEDLTDADEAPPPDWQRRLDEARHWKATTFYPDSIRLPEA